MELFTRDQYIAFRNNPEMNPITRRKIVIHGPTHARLVAMSRDFEGRAQAHTGSLLPRIVTRAKATPKQKTPILQNHAPRQPAPFKRAPRHKIVVIREKYLAIFVFGPGSFETEQMDKFASTLSTKYNIEVLIKCNKSINNTLSGICQRVLPSIHDPVIQNLYNLVKNKANSGHYEKVFVIGHNYGGMCASLVAELFNREPNNKVQVATLGSVYISPPEKTSRVNIEHYMFNHDVVLKCNKIRPDSSPHVRWITSKLNRTPRFTLQGEIHNSYEPVIQNILVGRNVNIYKAHF